MQKIKLSLFLLLPVCVFCKSLHIGSGFPYADLPDAAGAAAPGDSIIFHAGVYPGGHYISNLRGTEKEWILITTAPGQEAVVRGGNTAWQLSDPAFVKIRGLFFERQTVNGVNIDDGGDYSTPAHDLIFENCVFRDMEADGNNDLLKMSGVDHFTVINCRFENGSAGGSGIDMVGCHRGGIQGCQFESMGSNAIQAKGGTEHITIAANFFRNCGQRSVNMGGSTGLAYFRPLDAPFEAAHLYVYANIFIGSVAPVAFVGCINSHVINNTIIKPEKWVLRILQETVDPARFSPCGENFFCNNIIYMGDLSTHVNIGPNTRPGSFEFANNLWYNFQNPDRSEPDLPVTENGSLTGLDPLFMGTENFHLLPHSPAIGRVTWDSPPELDFDGQRFNNPRSIGAMEGHPVQTKVDGTLDSRAEDHVFFRASPNPFNDCTAILFTLRQESPAEIRIYNTLGQVIQVFPRQKYAPGRHRLIWNARQYTNGLYFVILVTDDRIVSEKILLIK
ncbi:T9SS type A sorting domain-containing protein [candidate division KSB1 bacterium]|nr:T9SS type A sorting domain-containing protein [candidate division KSB1 bacterium]